MLEQVAAEIIRIIIFGIPLLIGLFVLRFIQDSDLVKWRTVVQKMRDLGSE